MINILYLYSKNINNSGIIHQLIFTRTMLTEVFKPRGFEKKPKTPKSDGDKQKDYDKAKNQMMTSLAESIFSSILINGKIEKISHSQIGIVRRLSAKDFGNGISKELDFDVSQKDTVVSSENNEITKNFLIWGIKNIFDESPTSDRSGQSKRLVKELLEKGYTWRKIAGMLNDYWPIEQSGNVLWKTSSLINARRALLFIEEHSEMSANECAINLHISPPTLCRIKKLYMLNDKREAAMKPKE